MKIIADKLKKTTFPRRLPIMIVCALAITYGILYFSLTIGPYGLFIGGAIVGGLWSVVWGEVFQEKSPLKKLYMLDYRPYIIIFILVCILFGFLIFKYPLP